MNEDIPKIGCVQHDCDACANQEAQIAALEAKVGALQSLSDEYAERVTKEVEAVKLLRAALVHIHEYWNGEPNDVAMRDALDHIIDEADKALEETK